MPTSLEFGRFRLHRAERTLVRVDPDGAAQPVTVGARALDLLLVLVEHAGQIVSKRRLLDAVWPGGAVEDSNLTVQITNLRRVIDEGTQEPSLIRTVHGHGYLLTAAVRGVDKPVPRIVLARPDKAAIAVLPFRMMGSKPDQDDDFAEGLVDDVVTALAGMRSLSVIARRSASAYKDRTVDIRNVGRELGVRYLLEGGVRRSGARTRITSQLIEAASGNQIWAAHFDGFAEDVLDLQESFAASIARAIEPKLERAEIERACAMPAEEPTAYNLFHRALGLFHDQTEDSFRHALAVLDQAIALDPDYAACYGLAAWCCRLLVNYGRNDDEVIRARGFRMARLAVNHGKDDPFALALGGAQIALLGGAYGEGLAHIERALILNANSARAWELRGWVSFAVGAHDRSIECFKRAMQLSPSDPLSAFPYAGIAWPYFFTGRYDEAIDWANKACLEMPNSALPLRPKIACAALAGRTEDVQHASERLRVIHGEISVERLMRIDISRAPAQRDIVAGALRKAGIPESWSRAERIRSRSVLRHQA